MSHAPSRHDHFPRLDTERRQALRQSAAGAAADWDAADRAPGGLIAAMDALAGAPADAAVERLLPWLEDIGWLHARLDAALALLAADPFARPPLRPVGQGGGAGGLILAERGAIRLTLQLTPFAPASRAPGASLVFVPGRAAFRVLASGGALYCPYRVVVGRAEEAGGFTAAAAAACQAEPPRPLEQGAILRLDTARQGFTLAAARADVLLLELAVQPPSPLPIRSYDAASGRLVHVSASRRDSSFRAMALTLLRHLGRIDAAPLFAAETRAGDFSARWSAMRELLALDLAAARPPLAAMAAGDPHPEVRRAAAATLALLSSPPASGKGTGESPCP